MKKWRPLHLRDIIDPVLSQRLNTSTLEAGELRGAMEHLADALNDRFSQLFPGEDEPKPEPAPEDPPDYSCPICGESAYVAVDDYVEPGPCKSHEDHKMLAAANRRIDQLTRERDGLWRELREIYDAEPVVTHAADAKSVRAQAIQDTKDAAVRMLEMMAENCERHSQDLAAARRYLDLAKDIRNLELK